MFHAPSPVQRTTHYIVLSAVFFFPTNSSTVCLTRGSIYREHTSQPVAALAQVCLPCRSYRTCVEAFGLSELATIARCRAAVFATKPSRHQSAFDVLGQMPICSRLVARARIQTSNRSSTSGTQSKRSTMPCASIMPICGTRCTGTCTWARSFSCSSPRTQKATRSSSISARQSRIATGHP